MSKEVKNTIIITVFALVSGLALGLVHQVTAGPIAAQKQKALNEAYSAVISEASNFTDMGIEAYDDADHNAQISSVLSAEDASGAAAGYVVNVVSHGGYGGDIEFSVGIKNDGTIENISITAISETPGLGMKAQTEPDFINQFLGQSTDTAFALGDNVTAITSATFTSRCMTNGINAALQYYTNNLAGGTQ
ncbi:MAG: RnfABCDGE type electron transport complex subunit G [Lachnospiraceae bacterium]|nr:RnfABCDGE type electron transport complex subunit G [Lachnospiraceae bacterium]